MNEFEKNLHDALHRKEPPPGFADRVLSRIPERSLGWRTSFISLFRIPALRIGFAALCLCLMLAAFTMYTRNTQRRIAEEQRAKEQVLQALYIASTELNQACEEIVNLEIKNTRLNIELIPDPIWR